MDILTFIAPKAGGQNQQEKKPADEKREDHAPEKDGKDAAAPDVSLLALKDVFLRYMEKLPAADGNAGAVGENAGEKSAGAVSGRAKKDPLLQIASTLLAHGETIVLPFKVEDHALLKAEGAATLKIGNPAPLTTALAAGLKAIEGADGLDAPFPEAVNKTPPQQTVKPAVVANAQVAVPQASALLKEDEGLKDVKALTGVADQISTLRPSSPSPASAPVAQTAQAFQAAASASPPPAAQLVAAIKMDKGHKDIEVRLDPPELGRVHIRFSTDTAHAVKAVLTVERAETLDHLRRNADQFLAELKTAGFASVDLQFSERRESDFRDAREAFEAGPDAVEFAPETTDNIIYLSLRENAQLNMLV